MILTGKAKVEFENWVRKDINRLIIPLPSMYYPQNEILLNALIIEFFDSFGIYVGITYFKDNEFQWRIHYKDKYGTCNSRQQATEQAIKKANDLYNERKI